MKAANIPALLVATAAFLLTAGAGTAMAASVTLDGDTVTYTAADGEANLLTITDDGTNLTFDEATETVNGSDGCAGSGDATCPSAGVTRIVVELGDENDRLLASAIAIPLSVNAGEGDDGALGAVEGGSGDDTINGGPGNDNLDGMGGSDALNGEAGQDFLTGSAGDDTLNGGDGDDSLQGGDDADVLIGGAGFDAVGYLDKLAADTVTATLDGQPNDGVAGENDLIAGDVEDLIGGDATDRFTGDGAYNLLTGNSGDDVLDPAGGEDSVRGELGNDTITVRDGFADLVTCSLGTDIVIADTLDRVHADCETVDRADVPVAREDRPPTVAFAGPSENAYLPTASASTITAVANDDRGVAEVQLIDDGKVVGIDSTAPYTFSYRPQGDDVGRNTLVVIASDTAQQTASAVRPLRVGRFAPRALIAKVTPSRDRFAPFSYRTTGRIRLPRGITRARGCGKGRVSIQVKRGSKTISNRRVRLGKGCGFASRVVFHKRRRVGRGSLRFVVRFLGNSVLIPRSGEVLRARTS